MARAPSAASGTPRASIGSLAPPGVTSSGTPAPSPSPEGSPSAPASLPTAAPAPVPSPAGSLVPGGAATPSAWELRPRDDCRRPSVRGHTTPRRATSAAAPSSPPPRSAAPRQPTPRRWLARRGGTLDTGSRNGGCCGDCCWCDGDRRFGWGERQRYAACAQLSTPPACATGSPARRGHRRERRSARGVPGGRDSRLRSTDHRGGDRRGRRPGWAARKGVGGPPPNLRRACRALRGAHRLGPPR